VDVSPDRRGPLRIGQFTGFHGDRADGMAELIRSGVDVLTGDYLAELTMLVLRKNVLRGAAGYVTAFADLLERHAEDIARNKIKVVTNAGGLDPVGLADEIRGRCAAQGVELTVAAISGDDLLERLDPAADGPLSNMDTGEELSLEGRRLLTANAYLGALPIVEALTRGADVVVCPRTTDASLVVGPAAWRFGWDATDYHRLAGALVAGHVIECGAQATGGNYAFFAENEDLGLPGMPITEIESSGDSIITKSDDSGGLVSPDTVHAQLLYEVGGAVYQNPDVVADLSSITVAPAGTNRVRIRGARGFAPTDSVKLSLTYEGGYRNTMTIGVTGRQLPEKLAWFKRQVEAEIGPAGSFQELRWSVIGPADPHGTFEESTAWVVVTVIDPSRDRVNRTNFSDRLVQIAISSFPGYYLTTPPQSERLFGVQWPTLIAKSRVRASVVIDGETTEVGWGPTETPPTDGYDVCERAVKSGGQLVDEPHRVLAELGTLFGTRSGDKAGAANIGIWARSAAPFDWLVRFLTVDRFKQLLPETAGLRVERHVLTNLRGMNFVVYGYLGAGVSACTRIDPQAKGMGEYLASKQVEIPSSLLN
jgi:hypothetical protein